MKPTKVQVGVMTAGDTGDSFVTLIVTEYVDGKSHSVVVQMANGFAVDLGRQILNAAELNSKSEVRLAC